MSNLPLAGKTGIIFGVANKRSIAWAIAQAWYKAGAKLIFNYQGERLKENVEELVGTFGPDTLLLPCDVSSDEQIASFFDQVKATTDRVDMLLHSVAFAPKETLSNPFSQTSRESFRIAHDISSYSLIALSRGVLPFMETHGGSIMTMTYLGAARVVPNYNIMGAAKASLEASVRYLAADLGRKKIRVNAISAGPMNTLAARGIPAFKDMLDTYEAKAPLHRNVELDELGATGLFLATDGAAAITAQTLYVDSGYSSVAV